MMGQSVQPRTQPWKKPRSRMYEYNRVLGNEYYQPMVDYVLCKENQGVYHDYNIRHSTDLEEATRWQEQNPCGPKDTLN